MGSGQNPGSASPEAPPGGGGVPPGGGGAPVAPHDLDAGSAMGPDDEDGFGSGQSATNTFQSKSVWACFVFAIRIIRIRRLYLDNNNFRNKNNEYFHNSGYS